MSQPETLWARESKSRRILLGLLVYAISVSVFFAVAGKERLVRHTDANHYALLAEAWLQGRNDLPNGAPAYAGGNDFAEFNRKTYISFPPFPAVLMLPFVKLAGGAENFQDGQFVIWLSGLGPAFLFLLFEKLRRKGLSERSERTHVLLSLLFSFGTVYFFTAVQGTVWFSAHVVGVALLTLYLLFALEAEHPALAGLMLGCAFLTRPTMLLTGVFFGLELLRGGGELRVRDLTPSRVRPLIGPASQFLAPLLLCLAFASWMNHARFESWSPFAFGHEYLTVGWKTRIAKWGLFGLHYLPKNLGVSLTILPFLPPKGTYCFEGHEPSFVSALFSQTCTPFKVNEHGLALWFTTPLYFSLFFPKAKTPLFRTLTATALLPMAYDLLYQNSGWRQFGYRFSNDYSPALFAMLAISHVPFGWLFRVACGWSMLWNLFGAVTFNKAVFDRFYFRDGTQRILYQDD